MTTLTRWDPFAEMTPVREMMSRFLEDSYWPARPQSYTRPLPMDMYEAENEVIVKAALPGYSEKDVEVTLENGSLTVRAHHVEPDASEGHVRWMHRELWSGDSGRTVILPSGLQGDKATATFTDGILVLSIPKAEAAKPRQIKIIGKGGQVNG